MWNAREIAMSGTAKKHKILLVDDSPEQCLSTSLILERQGFEVDVFALLRIRYAEERARVASLEAEAFRARLAAMAGASPVAAVTA
jgi:hypothetical protein